jgi:anti-sigma regulatory factor (Ser/Thr protein kinase)
MNPREHTLRLDCDLCELAGVRTWLRTHLDRAGLDAGDALLVVTELAANAIEHAHSSPIVVLKISPDMFRIEVSDDLASPPLLRAHPDAGGGYGLRLIDRVTDQWDATQRGTARSSGATYPDGVCERPSRSMSRRWPVLIDGGDAG